MRCGRLGTGTERRPKEWRHFVKQNAGVFESAAREKSSPPAHFSSPSLCVSLSFKPRQNLILRGGKTEGYPPVCLHPEQIKYVGIDHKE